MKKKTKILLQISVLILCFLSFGNFSFAQDKINIKVGIVFPDIGVRYQLSQFQFGAYIGGNPFGDNETFTLSGDISYHFAGHSEFSKRKPWYLRSGYTHLKLEASTHTSKNRYLTLRIGRDLNLSDKFGFEIDLGYFHHLYHKEFYKDPILGLQNGSSETSSGIFFGFGIYYRLCFNTIQ